MGSRRGSSAHEVALTVSRLRVFDAVELARIHLSQEQTAHHLCHCIPTDNCCRSPASCGACFGDTHPGGSSFGGPHHLEGLSPHHSEVHTSFRGPSATSSGLPLPLLGNFLFCIRDFHVRCFARRPTLFFSHFIIAYSFLFSVCLHPYVLSILRVPRGSDTLCMCIHITMSIHSVYLVSDLEGSDNGDPTNGIIYCRQL
jgi:hypothetical protein